MSSEAVGSRLPALHVYPVSDLWNSTGGFHQICCVGEGGFGKVYRAMVNLTPVAIKVLDHSGLQGMKEFHNEMRLSASIQHQHVIRLLGYAAEGRYQCLVYELMANGNLEDIVATRSVDLPWPFRIRIAAQMANALSYLHTCGIIHRDIKPANVFLDHDLNAKLGDIGLASRTDSAAQSADIKPANVSLDHDLNAKLRDIGLASRADSLAHSGSPVQRPGSDASVAVGTWVYLAPEYKVGGCSSTATDVYALGLTLLQLLTAAEPRDLISRCQAALEQCALLQDISLCHRLAYVITVTASYLNVVLHGAIWMTCAPLQDKATGLKKHTGPELSAADLADEEAIWQLHLDLVDQ
eukprot:gene25110-10751_t